MNYNTFYNNYKNESNLEENEKPESILPYLGIFIILTTSFVLQCLKCKFNNYNNRSLKFVIKKDLEEGLIKECSICLNEMKKKDKLIILNCKHYYHKDCINEWLKKSKTCPECRLILN